MKGEGSDFFASCSRWKTLITDLSTFIFKRLVGISQMKNVLIIGAGLIGSQIAKLEVERGDSVVIFEVNPRTDAMSDIFDVSKAKVIKGDVLNPSEVQDLVKNERINRIIHTAANPLLTVGGQKNPYEAIHINIMGTANVLEAARQNKVERVVFTSSNVIAIHQKSGPDGLPRPASIYGSTKLACENLGFNYMDLFGLDFVVVRFAAAFGPWRYGGGGGPTQVFKEALEQSLRGEPSTVAGDTFEYVYSKDAAKACVLSCHAINPKKRLYNVGMGMIYSPAEIKQIIERVIPKASLQISTQLSAAVPTMKGVKPMDLADSTGEIGYRPEYDMQRAITDYVDWLRNMKA
ncbi:MAG: NAD-dependent epimerase/dehydratase family protein [Rhabdochlamydiaceae bacterium]